MRTKRDDTAAILANANAQMQNAFTGIASRPAVSEQTTETIEQQMNTPEHKEGNTEKRAYHSAREKLPESYTAAITLKMPPELRTKIKIAAARECKTINNYCVDIFKKYFD